MTSDEPNSEVTIDADLYKGAAWYLAHQLEALAALGKGKTAAEFMDDAKAQAWEGHVYATGAST